MTENDALNPMQHKGVAAAKFLGHTVSMGAESVGTVHNRNILGLFKGHAGSLFYSKT